MNEKFFEFPPEKRQKIIDSGYRVFSADSYKKSPVGDIAAGAGISKSLLFFYFRNKMELYLFLWDECAKTTVEYLTRYKCYDGEDLFEMMDRGMKAKLHLIREHPEMAQFAVKAFYEKDPEISAAIQKSYRYYFGLKALGAIKSLSPDDFIPGLDLKLMYRNMYLAAEGYLWEMLQRGDLDYEQLDKDFQKLLEFWKSVYKRKG